MVLKTGFNTTERILFVQYLFPKPVGFKFYEDSFKYIGFMALIAAIGFAYSTYNFLSSLRSTKKLMILRALDIITTVVPPALPATLTISTTFAISRLEKPNLLHRSLEVNIGENSMCYAFDKTGTDRRWVRCVGRSVANNATGRKEIILTIWKAKLRLFAESGLQ